MEVSVGVGDCRMVGVGLPSQDVGCRHCLVMGGDDSDLANSFEMLSF